MLACEGAETDRIRLVAGDTSRCQSIVHPLLPIALHCISLLAEHSWLPSPKRRKKDALFNSILTAKLTMAHLPTTGYKLEFRDELPTHQRCTIMKTNIDRHLRHLALLGFASLDRRFQNQPNPPESVPSLSSVIVLPTITDVCHGTHQVCQFYLDLITKVCCCKVEAIRDPTCQNGRE